MNSDELSDLVVEALEEIKGQDIVKLDVRDMTTVTDWMIVASGTSGRLCRCGSPVAARS